MANWLSRGNGDIRYQIITGKPPQTFVDSPIAPRCRHVDVEKYLPIPVTFYVGEEGARQYIDTPKQSGRGERARPK